MFAIVRLLVAVLAGGALSVPLSWSGKVIAFGVLLVAVAHPWVLRRRSKFFTAIGIVGVGGALAANVLSAAPPFAGRFQLAPGERPPGVISSLVREEDGVQLMAALLPVIGGITKREAVGLRDALASAYETMRFKRGSFPTPLARTYLGLQSSTAFDLIVLQPLDVQRSDAAVVFLHGSGGNWSLLCFLTAEASARIGAVTFCPSSKAAAPWKSSESEEIVRATIDQARSRGSKRIYLIGLSAGAIGAGKLGPLLQKELSGVAMLFGAHPEASALRIPSLVLYADNDERFPADWMEEVIAAQRAAVGEQLTARRMEGDHFALLKRQETVARELGDWLAAQQSPT